MNPVPHAPKKRSAISTRNARILTQILMFSLWVGLILATRHPIHHWLQEHLPVSLFLRADPLVGTVVMGGMRMGITILFLGLATALVSVIFGRVFCGWICPLGSIFDGYSQLLQWLKVKHFGPSPRFFRLKFYLLGALLILAFFGVGGPLIGLDPIVLLTRAAASVFQPLVTGAQTDFQSYAHWIDYSSFALFIGILYYTTKVSRIWCRTTCPLGAYLGAFSRVSMLRRETQDCVQCQVCSSSCPTGAIDFKDQTIYNESECIKCFVCSDVCPVDANYFQFQKPTWSVNTQLVTDLNRRSFLKTVGVTAAAVPILHLDAGGTEDSKKLIRPPMSRKEEDFLSSCIRCGECMKACPTQVLKPAGLSHGLRALWTPVMDNQVAACKPGCNACSVACPTDAIQKYPVEHKYAHKAGTAVFNSALCISHTDGKFCSECVRQCPTNAIEFEKGWEPTPEQHASGVGLTGADSPAPEGQKPTRPLRVRFDLCVGCGACELACNDIVVGEPAMKNTSFGRTLPTSVPLPEKS